MLSARGDPNEIEVTAIDAALNGSRRIYIKAGAARNTVVADVSGVKGTITAVR